ncbi:hypothetical protein K6T82_02055 [Flavobacterium sp. 17A]|uniref:Uncharacterized protein n=1 Tax=Flavobacterium potami TaxID=2872310 RepID=A0A9X1KNY2_9FLAO|nr:hypothetical protein [Flavobacterium potami]MBZ4033532.1 hypothetical protein [Flavobacterium potami]
MYVLKNDLPIISVRNSSEKDILDSKLSLKRNNTIADVGNLLVYSKSNNTIDISLLLKKTDTVYKTDTILVYIKDKCFTLSDIEKKGVVSSGRPFIISYKINNKDFIDRNGFYEL